MGKVRLPEQQTRPEAFAQGFDAFYCCMVRGQKMMNQLEIPQAPAIGYCLFETALGYCGIAWNEETETRYKPRVCFFQLPEATQDETESKLIGNFPTMQRYDRPPPEIVRISKMVAEHFAGTLHDFNEIAIDFAGCSDFAIQVYQAVRCIPAGQTRTYGEIAQHINRPTAARSVGQALAKNPLALIIPCHRVLASGGKSGGFSAFGGVKLKTAMLAIEGVH
jgi:O-6-methylguanine DNA methyltransferase